MIDLIMPIVSDYLKIIKEIFPEGFFRRGIRGKCFKILLGKFKKFEFHRRGGEGDLNLGKIKQMIIP